MPWTGTSSLAGAATASAGDWTALGCALEGRSGRSASARSVCTTVPSAAAGGIASGAGAGAGTGSLASTGSGAFGTSRNHKNRPLAPTSAPSRKVISHFILVLR